MNNIPRFPGVVFNTKTLQFDQVIKFPVDHPTIQDFFHYPLFFAIYNFQKQRWSHLLARNGVRRSHRQFDYIEDRMKLTHRQREAEVVHTVTNLTVNQEWSQSLVRNLPQWSSGMDVAHIKEDHIAHLELWGLGSFPIVIECHVVF